MPHPRVYPDNNARVKAYLNRWKERDPEAYAKYIRERSRRYREAHPEYLENRRKKYRDRRVRAILKFGGKCFECGHPYDGRNAAAFDFHHVIPEGKGGRALNSLFISGSDKALAEEISKCVLLCANCHKILHRGEF